MNKHKTTLAIFIIGFSLNSWAAKVIQSKNGKVMIDLEGENLQVNQTIVLTNNQNKRVAIGKINQVKNGKAIATILKGQAQGNEKVTGAPMKGAGATASASTSESTSDASGGVFRTQSKKLSVVVSLMSNSMDTKQADGSQPTPQIETVKMKGSTFGVTGVLDLPFSGPFVLRGTLGYEPYAVSGTAVNNSCDSLTSKNCDAKITYLTGGGYIRYNFGQTRTQFWAAAGGTLKFPMGKSTTALKQEDIKMTMTYGAGLGLDFFISNKGFIPVSAEQQMFMKSDTVTASMLVLRVGYGVAY